MRIRRFGWNAIACLWRFTPPSRSVMTWYHIMEPVAPLAKHWLFVDSDRGDWPLLLWLVGAKLSSVRDDLGHQLYCDWNNWFGSRISLFGVSALRGCLVIPTIYSALVLLETCNVQQNFCSPLRFVKLELFWPSEMLVEIELHAWRSFVEVLWTKTTLYRTVVIIYFVLECKELWLFKFGWEPRVFENFWK